MGFLTAAAILCSIHGHHGKLIIVPCHQVKIIPQEEIHLQCRGGLYDRSMSFPAVTGQCRQRTDA